MKDLDIIFPEKEIHFLPHTLANPEQLHDSFKELLGSDEANSAKGVVYFYCSEQPYCYKNGESHVLYIGKTKGSIKGRYLRYAGKLSNGRNGDFYRNIINNYGGVKLGYFFSDNPRADEKVSFSLFRKTYDKNPIKSKRG